MPSARLSVTACLLLTACAHPAWQIRGAGLAGIAGGDLVRACRDGQAEDCQALAESLEQAHADEPAQREAIYLLRLQGCEQGHAVACRVLGYNHVYGQGPNLDPARSQAALVQACQAGQPSPCHVAGSTLDEGRLGEVDEKGAYRLFVKGCEQDEPSSCAWVGLKLEFGRGAPLDRGKAFTFFDKACSLGEREVGCFNTALHLAERPEEDQDPGRVVELMQQACDAGNQTACENVEILRSQAQEPTEVEFEHIPE